MQRTQTGLARCTCWRGSIAGFDHNVTGVEILEALEEWLAGRSSWQRRQGFAKSLHFGAAIVNRDFRFLQKVLASCASRVTAVLLLVS